MTTIRRRMAITVIVTAMLPLEAGTSVDLVPGFSGTASVPSTAPFTNLSAFRMEMRIHNWTTPTATWPEIIAFGPAMSVQLVTNNPNRLYINDNRDSLEGGGATIVDITGRTDIILRIQRDPVQKLFSYEIWNADGTNYVTASRTITNVGTLSIAGTATLGSTVTSSIGFIRLYSFLSPIGSSAPGGTSGGDLADWEFEGTGLDQSGKGLNFSFNQTPVFRSTPVYSPLAHVTSPISVRAGSPLVLDGSRSLSTMDNPALKYVWQQIAGSSGASFSNRKAAIPTVHGLQVGEYTFRLTVIDALGQTGVTEHTVGVVATDYAGVVLGMPSYALTILGPQIHYGRNAWPWADDRHRFQADFFGQLTLNNTDPGFRDDWNTAYAGAVSVTQGSKIVTAVGADLKQIFCNGGTSPTLPYIVIWNPLPGERTGRFLDWIASCDSASQITLGNAYPNATTSGLSYSSMNCAACWINGSENRNYYDNVLAYYSLYYRTGVTKYRTYARVLADRWWRNPFIDEGRCNVNRRCPVARAVSMTGLVLYALETGNASMWAGLRMFPLEENTHYAMTHFALFDTRENAYELSWVALLKMFDPDPAQQSTYNSILSANKTVKWAPGRKAPGYWPIAGGGDFSEYKGGGTGRATVTAGSTAVTGIGTNWMQPSCPVGPGGSNAVCNNYPLLFSDAANGGFDDTAAYLATIQSNTAMTLNRPYEGPSKTNQVWIFGNIVGGGQAPFPTAIIANAFWWTWLATSDTQWRTWAYEAVDWITTTGYNGDALNPTLWYNRGAANCEPITPLTELNKWCYGSRFLGTEVMGALSKIQLARPNALVAEVADRLYGGVAGKLGGPYALPTGYAGELEDSSVLVYKKTKDFGFPFGVGGLSSWPAARLGGPSPARNRAVSFNFNLTSVAGATKVRITLSPPVGNPVVVMCTNSPCSVTTDTSVGEHLMKMEYLTSTNSVRSTTLTMVSALL